jgi:hypothetical protein
MNYPTIGIQHHLNQGSLLDGAPINLWSKFHLDIPNQEGLKQYLKNLMKINYFSIYSNKEIKKRRWEKIRKNIW